MYSKPRNIPDEVPESCPVARLKGLAAACALQRGRVDGAPLPVQMIQSDTDVLCQWTTPVQLYCTVVQRRGTSVASKWDARNWNVIAVKSLSISVHTYSLAIAWLCFREKVLWSPVNTPKAIGKSSVALIYFYQISKGYTRDRHTKTLSLTEISLLAALFLPSHPGPFGYGSRTFGQSNELLGYKRDAQTVSHASSRLNTHIEHQVRQALSSFHQIVFQTYIQQGLWIQRAVDRGSFLWDLGHVWTIFVQVLKKQTQVIRLHVKLSESSGIYDI